MEPLPDSRVDFSKTEESSCMKPHMKKVSDMVKRRYCDLGMHETPKDILLMK